MTMQITVTLDTETPAGRALLAQLLPGAELAQEDALVESAERTSDKIKANRQAAAANARAAKLAKQAPVDVDTDPVGDRGAADLAGPGTNGVDADPEEDLGLTDPSMSPAEAKEAGLVLVREIYAAGKVVEVKALQKEYGVAKFYDVPIEKGHAFHRRVMEVAHATGLR
jgi:hypothetical protein